VFVTFTTGHAPRLQLTANLLTSVRLNSWNLGLNVVVACLDEEACSKCPSLAAPNAAKCYCVGASSGPDPVGSSVAAAATQATDQYKSPVWARAVLMKVALATEIVDAGLQAIMSDHDVVLAGNFDDYFSKGPKAFFGAPWSDGAKANHPEPSAPDPAIVTMCDFPKRFRPLTREANTGFMFIDGTKDEAKKLVRAWAQLIAEEEAKGNVQDNDQPPFQRVSQRAEYLLVHRCADEPEGLAMWFHRKGKITGSGLSDGHYSHKQDSTHIKAFHTNDVKTSEEKIELMKRLGFWVGGADYDIVWTPRQTQRQWELSRTHASTPTDKKFYIYEWPENVMVVPDDSVKAQDRGQDENFGAGPVIDAGLGQFNTYMHSLWPIVYRRLCNHPRRTRDPTQAALFFVPYDVSRDAYALPKPNQVLPQVLDLLRASPHFLAAPEKHFFVDSSEPFWMEKKVVVEAFYSFCAKCVQLTPSTLVAPFQTKWAQRVSSRSMDRVIQIPYTSTWHYHELGGVRGDGDSAGDSKGTQQQQQQQQQKWVWAADADKPRKYVTTFMGIITKMNVTATATRRALVGECQRAGRQRCAMHVLNDKKWVNFGSEASVYQETDFCLLPGGDIAARKALFDMLLAGCIPVVFDWIGQVNFPWHLGDAAAREVAVEVVVHHAQVHGRRAPNKKRRPLEVA
jgi:hypothetical protein